MPLKLNIKKVFSQRSERVKSVDIHPTEPWALSALYNGHVTIWNFETQTQVKSFEVTEQPVRCAKFVARKQWIVAASDDMNIRVFNYNTMEKIKAFEAHTDYIRCVIVHPVHPYLISSSDDTQIKLWDWEKKFACVQVFEGHTHYVMQLCVNPKDTNTFASASLDRTIKVWTLGSQHCNFTLEGHERGVNCVDYYSSGDKPYLLSGADDNTVKIWDYQTKTCVQNLEGHTSNVSGVSFHPRLPIIVSSSEDGTVRIWHSTTYRAETTLNYGMERAWCIFTREGTNKIALGYDEGMVVIGLGHEEPIISMDPSGKVVWADNNDIQAANVKNTANEYADNEKLQLVSKDLGSCEIYPQALKHNCNGRFIVILGDGEYITYVFVRRSLIQPC
jgi:coatomer subunit beta'